MKKGIMIHVETFPWELTPIMAKGYQCRMAYQHQTM